MNGIITTSDLNNEECMKMLKREPKMNGLNLVQLQMLVNVVTAQDLKLYGEVNNIVILEVMLIMFLYLKYIHIHFSQVIITILQLLMVHRGQNLMFGVVQVMIEKLNYMVLLIHHQEIKLGYLNIKVIIFLLFHQLVIVINIFAQIHTILGLLE